MGKERIVGREGEKEGESKERGKGKGKEMNVNERRKGYEKGSRG